MKRTKLRTQVQLATFLRNNLPEKVATRNVNITMSTYRCTKAASTKRYLLLIVERPYCCLLFFFKHYNEINANELRTAKVINKLFQVARKITKFFLKTMKKRATTKYNKKVKKQKTKY